MTDHSDLISDLYEAVLDYDEALVKELVAEGLASGARVQVMLDDGLIAAMDEIGTQFSSGEIFVPEMLMAANAMKGGLQLLKPILAERKSNSIGRVVIGTVHGDLHDIGKNLVSMTLEGAGFDVFDIGVDAKADAFIEAVRKHDPDIVALSALLTTTMGAMRIIIDRLRDACPGIKVIVGGAPVTAEFAAAIAADGFGGDAAEAVQVARRILQAELAPAAQ